MGRLPVARIQNTITKNRLTQEEVLVGGILWGVAILLVVLWVLGKLIFGVASALIHLLLIIAVVVIIVKLLMAAMRRA
jgi:predicted lipid-binding transport protein (Tim44 family)